jgi:hypothetical protein
MARMIGNCGNVNARIRVEFEGPHHTGHMSHMIHSAIKLTMAIKALIHTAPVSIMLESGRPSGMGMGPYYGCHIAINSGYSIQP